MNGAKGKVTRRTFCAAGAGLAAFGFNRLAVAAQPETGKMISQIARFKLNTDQEAKALKALGDLCAAVEKTEPGVLVYLCHRVAKKHDEIVFFEVFQDEAALKAHAKMPHFTRFFVSFGTLFRLPLEITRLDRLGGFARATEPRT